MDRRVFRKIAAAAVTVLLPLTAAPARVLAQEDDGFLYGTLTEVSTYDKEKTLTDSFYYSDAWFEEAPEVRNDALALASMQLCAAAVNDDPDGYGTAFLEELGFTGIGYAGFGSADPEDCAYTYAQKTLKDGTVLTVVCIQSYALDSETKIKGWKQNFTVNGESCEGEHAGFGTASDRVIDAVAALGGDRIWITGQSRGGAIANLIAAKLREKTQADIYAYTFEAPAVTDAVTDPSEYAYIHNYLCSDDIAARVPVWDMVRFGNEYQLKTEETDSGLAEELEKLQSPAAAVSPEPSETEMLKLIQVLEAQIPSREDYSRVRTDTLIEDGEETQIVYSYQEELTGLFGMIFGGELADLDAVQLMEHLSDLQEYVLALADAVILEQNGNAQDAVGLYWKAACGIRSTLLSVMGKEDISASSKTLYALLKLAGPLLIDTGYTKQGDELTDMFGYITPALSLAANASYFVYSHHFDTLIARLKVLAPQPVLEDMDITLEAPAAGDPAEKAEKEITDFISAMNCSWLSAEAEWNAGTDELEDSMVYYMRVTLKAAGHSITENTKLTLNGQDPEEPLTVSTEDGVSVIRGEWKFNIGTPEIITVSFDTNGHGTALEPVSLEKGTALRYVEAPVPENDDQDWEFTGWQSGTGSTWDEVTACGDITFTARWVRVIREIHISFAVPEIGGAISEPIFEEDEELLELEYWEVTDDNWNMMEVIGTKGTYILTLHAALKDPQNTKYAETEETEYAGTVLINGELQTDYCYDPDGPVVTVSYPFTVTAAQPVYTAEEGSGAAWTKGSQDGLQIVFRCSIHDEQTYDLFRGITVDGSPADPSMYDAEAGSLILKLKPEYLETLDIGEHTLEAQFEDGTGTAQFTIAAPEVKPEPVPEPEPEPIPESVDTGDPNNPMLWTSLLGGSLAVILIVLYLLKRNRKE